MAFTLVKGLIYFPKDAFSLFADGVRESRDGRSPVGLIITGLPEDVLRDNGIEASRFIDPRGRSVEEVLTDADMSRKGVHMIVLIDISSFADDHMREPQTFVEHLMAWLGPDEVLILHSNREDFLKRVEEEYLTLYSLKFFDILVSPIRRRVVELLSSWERASFARLQEFLGVKPPSKLSYHIKELKEAGLIRHDKDMLYTLTDKGIMAALALGTMKKDHLEDMEATFK